MVPGRIEAPPDHPGRRTPPQTSGEGGATVPRSESPGSSLASRPSGTAGISHRHQENPPLRLRCEDRRSSPRSHLGDGTREAPPGAPTDPRSPSPATGPRTRTPTPTRTSGWSRPTTPTRVGRWSGSRTTRVATGARLVSGREVDRLHHRDQRSPVRGLRNQPPGHSGQRRKRGAADPHRGPGPKRQARRSSPPTAQGILVTVSR